jgi:2-phospho-L-lactate/phosphoenolpyruvate guanylyltransferase
VSVQILIPLKHLASAKRRLHPAIDAGERRRLVLQMLGHVAREALEAGVGPVALATSEPRAAAIAKSLAVGLAGDGGLPWNEGLAHALGLITPQPDAVLYLAADLPLVTAREIRAIAEAASDPGVAIGRAHDGGTNALAVRPAAAVTPCFGVAQSARAHARLAEAAGLAVALLDLPGLALDVDTPDDIARARLSA